MSYSFHQFPSTPIVEFAIYSREIYEGEPPSQWRKYGESDLESFIVDKVKRLNKQNDGVSQFVVVKLTTTMEVIP